MKKIFSVSDMTCNHCVVQIEEALGKIKGIKLDINIVDKTIIVTSKKEIDASIITNKLDSVGYKAIEIQKDIESLNKLQMFFKD